jgi:hypothetical protein
VVNYFLHTIDDNVNSLLTGGDDVLAPAFALRLIEEPEAPVTTGAYAVQQVYLIGV